MVIPFPWDSHSHALAYIRHQLEQRYHGYVAGASSGVPVYAPDFAGTGCAYTHEGMAG